MWHFLTRMKRMNWGTCIPPVHSKDDVFIPKCLSAAGLQYNNVHQKTHALVLFLIVFGSGILPIFTLRSDK
jgi:hypothetical protein